MSELQAWEVIVIQAGLDFQPPCSFSHFLLAFDYRGDGFTEATRLVVEWFEKHLGK